MLLNQEKTDKLLAFLKRRYPRWSGFADQRFSRDTAALRPDTLEGVELLNEAALRQLEKEHRWDEIIGRIDFIVRSAAAATQNAPALEELEPLHDSKIDKPAFCAAIIDLMFGDDDSAVRLQKYADLVEAHHFPTSWGLPTLLLMLLHPFTDCYVKPEAISWFLDFAGKPFELGGLNGSTYTRIQKLAREVAIHFEDGSMVEMPVIQRLIWLCFLEGKSEVAVAPTKLDVIEPNPVVEKAAPAEVAMIIPKDASAEATAPDFKIINIDRESEDSQKSRSHRHKESALDVSAFELLEAMERTPLSQKTDKAQRDVVLEKPALALVREVMGHLPERVKSEFFSVPLTAYGTERSHSYLNVSFYRKGGKWRGEPQLYFVFTEEGIECGYSIEWFTGLYLERFQMNFAKNEALMAAWLEDLASDQIGLRANRVRGADGSCAFRPESFIGENREIRIGLNTSRDQVLGNSRSKLAGTIAESIIRLFPVLQLALDEDPFAEKEPVAPAVEVAPVSLPAPVVEEDGDVTLLEADRYLTADDDSEEETPDIEKTVVLQNIDMLASVAGVPASTEMMALAAMAASIEAMPELREAEEFVEASRLEPEENEDAIEVATKVEEVSGPAVTIEKIAEPVATIEEKKSIEEETPAAPETKEAVPPVSAPEPIHAEEKRGSLLEVLAREVEGRSWSESLRPATNPARRIESETGARTAARASEAAVLEEFEVLGIRHRLNTAYSISQCAEETGFSENQIGEWLAAIDRKGQAVFYGPPGTGKTFMAEKLARHLIGSGDGFSRLIQMHAGVTYDDFIEARRPASTVGREARMVSIPGRFVEFCREAEGRTGVCVLVLDEMHRADIATVIGELLYLLEHRGQEIQLTGGTRFRVPANVRLIGTMNTADRSNAFLDTAIRRRFAFLELGPRYEVLRHFHRGAEGVPVEELIGLLESINRRIANKRFEIGITYFLRPDTAGQVESIWRTEIEPLVGDFFFDQPGAADAFTWDAVRTHLRPS